MRFKNLAIIFFVVFTLTACSLDEIEFPLKSSIVGTWESVSEKYELLDKNGKVLESENEEHKEDTDKETYSFKADKTGSVKTYDDNEWSTSDFTYVIKNNKSVVIKFISETNDELNGVDISDLELEFDYTILEDRLLLVIEGISEEGTQKSSLELKKK